MNFTKQVTHFPLFSVRAGCALCLLLLLSFSLAACGGTGQEDAPPAAEDYVYVSKEISGPPGDYPPANFRADGRYLYYTIASALYRVPLTGEVSFADRELVSPSPENALLADYALSASGDLYRFIQNTSFGKDWTTLYTGGRLVRQTASGDKIYELSLPDANTMINSTPCLAVDQTDRAFLLTETGIYVVDAEGNFSCKISTDGCKPQEEHGKEQLLQGEDGRIYYLVCSSFSTASALYEITGEGAPQLTRRDEILQDTGSSFSIYLSGGQGLLCEKDDDTLWQYSEADNAWQELLRLSDSNLAGDVSELAWLDGDTILVYFDFFGAGSEPALFLLAKTPAHEIPQKENLTLATTVSWSDLPATVAAFNRMSDRYHITLEVYEGEEGLMRLDSALVSDNPPDLLDLRNLSLAKYAGKGALSDLTPYLERSGVLSREDFLENVLDGYTMDGKLCCIPSSFSFLSVFGRTSQVGDAAGWTMEDAIAMTEEYPESRLLDRNNFEYVLSFFCSDYIWERFIDWETGECCFDSPEFTGLMEWIRKHTKNVYLGFDENEDYLAGVIPDDLLLVRKQITSPRAFAMLSYDWNEPFLPVGVPTADGRPLSHVYVSDALAIVSGAEHPDGAWAFIEYLLSKTETDAFSSFSSRKDLLQSSVEEETIPLYDRDADGNPVIHEHFFSLENGEWVEHWNEPMMRARSAAEINGETIYYYYMEQEQADILLNLLENLDFAPQSDLQNEVIDIIMEEIAPSLTGDKAMGTAVEIIQNRVQTLIQESL